MKQDFEDKPNKAMELLIKAQIETNKEYNDYKNEFYEFIKKCDTTEKKLELINYDIKSFLSSKLASEEDYFKNNSAEERLNSFNLQIEILDELIRFLKNQYLVYKDIYEVELEEKRLKNNRGLTWNGPQNVLIYEFQKMKKKATKEGKSYLPHSNEEIAYHLKANYSCFENSTVATIKNQLERNNPPKRSENSLDIDEI